MRANAGPVLEAGKGGSLNFDSLNFRRAIISSYIMKSETTFNPASS
jgi:hypothetical protein